MMVKPLMKIIRKMAPSDAATSGLPIRAVDTMASRKVAVSTGVKPTRSMMRPSASVPATPPIHKVVPASTAFCVE